MPIFYSYYDSPLGRLILGSYGDTLCLCDWPFRHRRAKIDARLEGLLGTTMTNRSCNLHDMAREQLHDYFLKKREQFQLPLLFAGSDFQKRVWNALTEIPYGSTTTYANLSQAIGNPNATRAVASANGANALSLFIPCHRVIGSDGRLVGYAGGLSVKQYLLNLEREDLLL